ncbi:MAG TPA: hypothetical protein VMV45_11805, partial [Casimicrobiaceae bacterium]|nr:hypothetical protein [Casimicrobiaceae bacterium]
TTCKVWATRLAVGDETLSKVKSWLSRPLVRQEPLQRTAEAHRSSPIARRLSPNRYRAMGFRADID